MKTPVDALELVPAAVTPAASTTIQTGTDDTAPATAPVAPSKIQQVMEQQAQRKENGEGEDGSVGVDTWHGGGRKVGMDVLVKAEYRVPQFVPLSAFPASSPPPAPTDHGLNGNGSKKKGGGRNHKRPRDDVHADKDEGLCRSFLEKRCTYGDGCKFSHDTIGYLERKPADLGPVCPVFSAYGECPSGVTCRFGGRHIDKGRGLSLVVAKEGGKEGGGMEGGVTADAPVTVGDRKAEMMMTTTTAPRDEALCAITPSSIPKEQNIFPGPSLLLLRRNAYPFLTPRATKQGGKQGGKQGKATKEQASVEEEGKEEEVIEYNLAAFPERERKLIDWGGKVYVAPLTTVGNLPFRRVMKDLGADITCGEMALANNLLGGQKSETALLRRHPCEDVFGIQLAGAHTDMMTRTSELLVREGISMDFIDLNLGCPLDLVNNQGMGAALMCRASKLRSILSGMSTIFRKYHPAEGGAAYARLPSCPPITIKMRTGWDDKKPIAHQLVPQIQQWAAAGECDVGAVFIHGRSRQQRYTKKADWNYLQRVAAAQNTSLPLLPVIGNGDILSYTDHEAHKVSFTGSLEPCAMLGRGALIKPWLPTEIKEQRHWDISANERLDILKNFVAYGLEHWGSDQRGVNTTRRFLLEWLSFLHRYVPVGLLEHLNQPLGMNDRPMPYKGRSDLESLMASPYDQDWIKISEILLGPVPASFQFVPKHKANSWENANG